MFRTALISMCVTSVTLADTWTVDDDGKADFDNIQAAVDTSSDGDEIIVMPGTYTSKLPRVVHMKGKAIWLHSDAGPEVTIIDGQGIGRGIYCPSFQSDKTVIEGFTIRNGYSQTEGGGIRCNNDSNITIVNCILENCYSEQGGGGMDCGTSSPTIINCTFNKNVANFYGGGIRIANSDATIIDCVFTENQGLGGGGIYAGGSNSTLENCLFQGNIGLVSGGGIRCTNSNLMTLTDTTICGNTPDQIVGSWTDGGYNTIADECPTDCPDIDGDGIVNVTDLLAVIDQWGSTLSDADINGDGIVNVTDLLEVVGNWGPCPQ
jgi:predicted outer membrane repeat protein